MATEKQLQKWYKEAKKYNQAPQYADAYARYKQLAKQADQRLVRLEALSHEKHFKGVLEYSYKRAIRDIQSWGGKNRFNVAPPKFERDGSNIYSITQLEAKIHDIETFLNKPTSTKKSIISMYKKRTDTINRKYAKEYGVTFTWEELANYYEMESNRKIDSQYGSKTIMRVLALMKKEKLKKKDIDSIKGANEKIERDSSNAVTKVTDALYEQGLTFDNLTKR